TYREQGYLPAALLNYLVRLGWSHGDQEIFSLGEMLEHFDIGKVQGGASTFDFDKLKWVNHEHIQHDDPATVATELRWHLERLGLDPDAGPALTAIVEVQRERSHTLVEMAEQSAFLFREVEEYDAKAVKKHMKA